MNHYKDFYKDKAIGKKGFGIHSHQRKLVKGIKCRRNEENRNITRISYRAQSNTMKETVVEKRCFRKNSSMVRQPKNANPFIRNSKPEVK